MHKSSRRPGQVSKGPISVKCESTDETPLCILAFYSTTQYLHNIVTGRKILVPFLSHTVVYSSAFLEGLILF